MNREEIFSNSNYQKLFNDFLAMHQMLDNEFIKQYKRSLPIQEEMVDRWERATKLGMGTGTSIYDSAFVFGEVKVGTNCWIGPYTIIDGSGELTIGNSVTISTGVHIYTHDNVQQTLSGGKLPIEREQVRIGDNAYIGPQSIITKGVSIGNMVVVAANSFINKSCPNNTIWAGNPARQIGKITQNENGSFHFDYNKE